MDVEEEDEDEEENEDEEGEDDDEDDDDDDDSDSGSSSSSDSDEEKKTKAKKKPEPELPKYQPSKYQTLITSLQDINKDLDSICGEVDKVHTKYQSFYNSKSRLNESKRNYHKAID